jgi:uncharacterized repeat protein (TIGR01451 family)
MFKKLLSNLPFNPSLIGQVSFYAKRIHRETSIRRFGFFFLSLAFILQIFAVMSPAEASLNCSDNDIIHCGITGTAGSDPKHNLLVAYDSSAELRSIFSNWNITKQMLANTQLGTIDSHDHGINSLGRNHYFAQDLAVPIAGKTYYLRPLYLWGERLWPSLNGIRDNGQPFAVMLDCGNIALKDIPKPAPAPSPTPSPTPTRSIPSTPSTPLTSPTLTPAPTPTVTTTPNLKLGKTARNITQNGVIADTVLAAPGDTIEYKFSISNTGTGKAAGFVVQDNLRDILQYADIQDSHGGQANADKIISWPKIDIAPGQTIDKLLTVRVKNPVPQTNNSPSDPNSYDCIMTNVYGESVINIKVRCSVAKTTEVVTTKQLPNTGPGESIALASITTMIVAYFFARSQLVAKELDMVKDEYSSSGSN